MRVRCMQGPSPNHARITRRKAKPTSRPPGKLHRRLPTSSNATASFRRRSVRCALPLEPGIEPRKHPAGIAFEYLVPVGVAQADRINIALGAVELLSHLTHDALNRAHLLRANYNVVNRLDL